MKLGLKCRGTLYEMEMDEALAVLALVATDPSFPSFVSDAEQQALGQALGVSLGPAILDREIAALAPAQLAHTPQEGGGP